METTLSALFFVLSIPIGIATGIAGNLLAPRVRTWWRTRNEKQLQSEMRKEMIQYASIKFYVDNPTELVLTLTFNALRLSFFGVALFVIVTTAVAIWVLVTRAVNVPIELVRGQLFLICTSYFVVAGAVFFQALRRLRDAQFILYHVQHFAEYAETFPTEFREKVAQTDLSKLRK